MQTEIVRLTKDEKTEAINVIVDALYDDEYYSSSPKQELYDLYDEVYDIAIENGAVLAIQDSQTKKICGVAVFVDVNNIKDDEYTFDFVLGVENQDFADGINAFNQVMLQDNASTYLYGVGIDKDYRGQNLGSRLLLGAGEILLNKTIYADVTHDSVLRFYEHLGFEIEPIFNMFLIKKKCLTD